VLVVWWYGASDMLAKVGDDSRVCWDDLEDAHNSVQAGMEPR